MSIRNTMSLHRGIVTRSSTITGDVFVKIPEILGSSESISVSKDFLYEGPSGWVVPEEGSQIIVGLEGDLVRNVYLISELRYMGQRLSNIESRLSALEENV